MTNLRIALLVAVLAFTVWGILKVDTAMKGYFKVSHDRLEAIK